MKRCYFYLEIMWSAMAYRLIIALLLIGLSGIPLCAQMAKVRPAQSAKTTLLLRYLEEGKVDSMLPSIDPILLQNDTSLLRKLKWASSEIRQIKDSTEVSNGLILIEGNHYIYHCVYHTADTDYISVSFHYLNTDINALVVKIDFEDKRTLMDAKNRRRQQSKEDDDDIPPPPQPPTIRKPK